MQVTSRDTSTGPLTRTYTLVPSSVYRTLTGSIDSPSPGAVRSTTVTSVDATTQIRQVVLAASGFVQSVDLQSTFANASSDLKIELLASSGTAGAAPGTALFLLPSQFGPADELSTSSSSVASAARVAMVSRSSLAGPTTLADGTYTTDSDLTAFDNSLFYIAVWETEFRIDADMSAGVFTAYRANMQAMPRSPNWICDYVNGAWDAAFYPTPSSTGAKAWGEGRFYGVFPLPLFASVWHGIGHHEHQLTLNGWTLWETGTIDAFGPELLKNPVRTGTTGRPSRSRMRPQRHTDRPCSTAS